MATIKPNYNVQVSNGSISKKQVTYDLGYKAVKGDRKQQERAKKIISDLNKKFGSNYPMGYSSVYAKLATILSKDENATADDVLNIFNQLSYIDNGLGQALRSPKAVEEILDMYISDVGRDVISANAYLKSDYITVSSIQYALEQWSKGVEYHIPTQPKIKDNTEPQGNSIITPDNVFKHMEQNANVNNVTLKAVYKPGKQGKVVKTPTVTYAPTSTSVTVTTPPTSTPNPMYPTATGL